MSILKEKNMKEGGGKLGFYKFFLNTTNLNKEKQI